MKNEINTGDVFKVKKTITEIFEIDDIYLIIKDLKNEILITFELNKGSSYRIHKMWFLNQRNLEVEFEKY